MMRFLNGKAYTLISSKYLTLIIKKAKKTEISSH